MDNEAKQRLLEFYEHELLEDVEAFWSRHGPDREIGGFFTYLSREGMPLDTDKGMWVQARAAWLYSTLYSKVAARPEWLQLAEHAIVFIDSYGFDADGRMFFLVDRRGSPLRKRRYVYTEIFTVMAFAAFGKAAMRPAYLTKAVHLAAQIEDWLQTPGALDAKIEPKTRSLRSHATTMIRINMYQVLRDATGDQSYTDQIAQLIAELEHFFVKPDLEAVLETVLSDASPLDSPEGRTVNPGHSIETASFLFDEARISGNKRYEALGMRILDWSLALGRDHEHGGLLYFVDVSGKPAPMLEWDMKLWWVHSEALYALLQAVECTGDSSYKAQYQTLHDYTWSHFPDREYGEWYGYLHRDGSVSLDFKANHWKGPFHIPRQLMNTTLLLRSSLEGTE